MSNSFKLTQEFNASGITIRENEGIRQNQYTKVSKVTKFYKGKKLSHIYY